MDPIPLRSVLDNWNGDASWLLGRSLVEMAAPGGITDDLVFNLAEDIETDEQMEALGRTLGFKTAAINRYRDTNNKGDRVTCKGTRDMLFDWRQTVNLDNQHAKLNQALTQANLIMLSQKYLHYTESARGMDNKNISGSLNVLQCRQKLENKYLNNLCKIPMKPWDKNDYAEFKDMHTRVTIVKKDARGKDTRKKETLDGSVAEIFSKKVNGKLPVRILISAAAGRGKTTAVAKMAYDWSHRVPGSALEHLPLLFVLKLRNSGHRISIGEAIKSQLLSDVDDLTPNVIESFIRNNQGICHIIFDGLDEYAGIKSSKQDAGSNIVSIMRWDEYPECRVLVTTRPHLENFFNEGDLPMVYTKMEIEGFSRENSRDYIDRFFASYSDPSMAEGLKTYLGRTPLVNELVITPLFCLMVCHLWTRGLLLNSVATQTELLDNVNVFLMQHANARSKSKGKFTIKRLGIIISKIGRVALDGLLSDANKLVFTSDDFRKIPSILTDACELGIVSKTSISSAYLPRSDETTSTIIEFYHKLAQEHSAAKHIVNEINGYWLPWMRWNRSKLDEVLRMIKAHIGDYEHILRFTAGTGDALCIKILEAVLTNESLVESERYRILLDCSSETTPRTEGNVSSLVRRCVTSQKMVLKSPTLYTVIGMQNLPGKLKRQVKEITFISSTITSDVTNELWTCLRSFTILHLTISDSSLSFPPSSPELPYVTKLTAKGVTKSQSYVGLLSSLPGLEEVEITIDDSDISQITADLQRTRIKLLTRISLTAPRSLPSEKKGVLKEMMRGLGLNLIKEEIEDLQEILIVGVKGRDVKDLVDFFIESLNHSSTLHRLFLEDGCGSINYFRCDSADQPEAYTLEMKECQLSTEMTDKLWSFPASFTTLHDLNISDSSLSFPRSPPELPYVTKLTAKRVTSQSYEGLLSSLPGLEEIYITIDEADRDISQMTAGLQRTGREQLIRIALTAPPSEKRMVSRQTMRRLGLLIKEHTNNLQELYMYSVECRDEDGIDLIESCRHVKMMKYITLYVTGTKEGSRLNSHLTGLGTSSGGIRVGVSYDYFDWQEYHIHHV